VTTPPRSIVTPALAAAFVAALTLGPGGAQAQQQQPKPSPACAQALADYRAAAAVNIPPQRAYDDTVAGLAANAHCTDPVLRIVNAGYLLSLRAMAERNLRMGDWRRDFQMADEYLGKCASLRKQIGGHAADCRAQQADNKRFETAYAAAAATPVPTPSPTPAPLPAPATPGPIPGAVHAQPQPTHAP